MAERTQAMLVVEQRVDRPSPGRPDGHSTRLVGSIVRRPVVGAKHRPMASKSPDSSRVQQTALTPSANGVATRSSKFVTTRMRGQPIGGRKAGHAQPA